MDRALCVRDLQAAEELLRAWRLEAMEAEEVLAWAAGALKLSREAVLVGDRHAALYWVVRARRVAGFDLPPWALLLVAEGRLLIGDYEDAGAVLSIAEQHNCPETRTDMHELRAELYRRTGNPLAAARILELLLHEPLDADDRARVLYRLSECYFELGRYDSASARLYELAKGGASSEWMPDARQLLHEIASISARR